MRKYLLVDDVTGDEFDPAKDEGQEGVVIEFNGERVAIDLTNDSIEKLRKKLAPYLEHGAEVKPEPVAPKRVKAAASAAGRMDRGQAQAMRTWLREQGYEISDRGRIPQTMQEAYNNRGKTARPAALVDSAPTVKATAPKPPLPTREELARVHEQAKVQTDGLFSHPSEAAGADLVERDQADEMDGDTEFSVIKITNEGLVAFLESRGMNVKGMRFPARMAAFKKANPGKTVQYIKEAS